MARSLAWGILGAGRVSHEFALSLRLLPEARVAAVCSRTREHAQHFAATLGVPRWYTEPSALCADREIDIVYIATPAGLHEPHALAAIAGGKAVLIEKPFAVSADAARRIVAAARAARVFCMEAMWMRFVPLLAELKARLARGEIGDVRWLQAELGFSIPYREGSRYHDPALGGGALLDLGIYPLSLAHYLLGAPTGAHGACSLAHGVDEQACITLSYPRALAQLSCSFVQRARNGIFVLGSGGCIEVAPPLYAPTEMTIVREGGAGGARRLPGLVDRFPRWVELRRRLTPALKLLLRRNRRRVVRHFSGFGYQFEAAEAARCLTKGQLESAVMPLDETVAVLELMDHLRGLWSRAHPPRPEQRQG